MAPSPSLAELNAVVALARSRSFRRAAGELGVSASALSHSIAVLEGRLGVRLFNRTTRSVSLTAAGESFLARVQPALAELDDAVEAINAFRDTPAGVIRINSSAGAAEQVMDLFLAFMAAHPQLELDLVTEGRLVDIVAGGFDAGIRIAPLVPQDMIAVPLGPPVRYLVVGSPNYFDRRGRPAVLDDLRKHDCVRWRLPSGALGRWDFAESGVHLDIEVSGRFLFDSTPLMLRAALDGAALVQVNEFAARPYLATGQLETVLDDWAQSLGALQLYYPANRHPSAALRALVRFVRQWGKEKGAAEATP